MPLNSLDPDRIPMVKMIIHGAQIILIFVIWCLEINVFVDKKSTITGQNGWTFGAVRGLPCPFHSPPCRPSSQGRR